MIEIAVVVTTKYINCRYTMGLFKPEQFNQMRSAQYV